MGRITQEAALRALYGEKSARSVAKELHGLDTHCRTFIAASPFLVMSTSGPDGLDVTPRGDAPGFVIAEDDTHLLIPDRPGNNRLDNLTNLLGDPAIGLIFMIPGVRETLRVRGIAEIHDDADLCDRCTAHGKPALSVLRVKVTRAYLHCAKSMLRSGLWQPQTWAEQRPVPTMGKMIADQTGNYDQPESEEQMLARYAKALY